MQKPWSFRAIKLIVYVQIGLAFIVSSYGILFLIVREVLTFRQPFFDQMPVSYQAILNFGYTLWVLLMMPLGSIPMPVKQADLILGIAIGLFFEFIVSSVILFILKTKSLVVIKRTAILVLLIKITSGEAIVSWGLLISIFTLCSILVVAFLFLKPVQHYIRSQSRQHNNLAKGD